MTEATDPRIPVLFAPAALAPGDHVLRMQAAQAHAAGCRCCGGRGALAAALGALFVRRARGETEWFTRIVISTDNSALLSAMLREDSLISARFRLI